MCAGRYTKGSGEDNPKRWKATFRCGLNSCNSARARTIVPQPTLDEECKRAHRPARVFLIVDDADYRQWVRETAREHNTAAAAAVSGSAHSMSSSSVGSSSSFGSSELQVEAETGETKMRATRLKRPVIDCGPSPNAPTDALSGGRPHAKRRRTRTQDADGDGEGDGDVAAATAHCRNKASAKGMLRFQGIILPSNSLQAGVESQNSASAAHFCEPLCTSFGKSLRDFR